GPSRGPPPRVRRPFPLVNSIGFITAGIERGLSRMATTNRASGRVPGRSGGDRDDELHGVAGLDAPGDGPELAHATVVAEHVVRGQAHLLEVLDALLVARGGEHRVGDVLGPGDLRG